MMRSMAALALTSLLAAGCGEGGPELVPVEGTVTYNGKPLEGASLTFLPDAQNAEPTPGGSRTDDSGHYLATYRDRSGLATGKYKVLVAKKLTDPGKSVPTGFEDDPGMVALPEMGMSKDTLPTSYLDPSKTPLAIEVPDGGGTFDFDVKGASK